MRTRGCLLEGMEERRDKRRSLSSDRHMMDVGLQLGLQSLTLVIQPGPPRSSGLCSRDDLLLYPRPI